MITILSLLFALSIVVFVHELGHFVSARRARIVVEEFGFGYPPRLWALWRGKGKIVIAGQEIVIPRNFKLPAGLTARTPVLYKATTDRKGRQVLTHLEQADGAEQRIDLLDPGTVYSINAIPFGGFVKMLGEEDPSFPGSFASKSKLTRIGVLAAGAGMNLLTAVLFFSLALGLGAPAIADPENAVIASVSPGSPAEAVGLQIGDVILQANDTDILTVQSLIDFTQTHLGQPVVLTLQRGEQTLQITVVPRREWPAGDGPMGIGLRPRTTIKRYPWYQVLWMGPREALTQVILILSVPVQLIKGLIPTGAVRPSGPVGIGQLVGDAVRYSLGSGWWYPVMYLMGSLGVAVALTNLLPLPGLDGGRILFVIIERIRGRRVEPAKEGLVHLIGMIFLVVLLVFITWQDLVNPIPAIDWSRLFR